MQDRAGGGAIVDLAEKGSEDLERSGLVDRHREMIAPKPQRRPQIQAKIFAGTAFVDLCPFAGR